MRAATGFARLVAPAGFGGGRCETRKRLEVRSSSGCTDELRMYSQRFQFYLVDGGTIKLMVPICSNSKFQKQKKHMGHHPHV